MSTADELREKGVRLFHQHDYEDAVQMFEQARAAYDEADDRTMAAEMQINIGLMRRMLGEHQAALGMMQGALAVFEEVDDTLRVAKTLGNLGGVYAGLGDREQAYQAYRQAADLFDELGETKLHGETLVAIGDLQIREGKISAGAATYTAGLSELDHLSASQKIIKGLAGVVHKITGGGQNG